MRTRADVMFTSVICVVEICGVWTRSVRAISAAWNPAAACRVLADGQSVSAAETASKFPKISLGSRSLPKTGSPGISGGSIKTRGIRLRPLLRPRRARAVRLRLRLLPPLMTSTPRTAISSRRM